MNAQGPYASDYAAEFRALPAELRSDGGEFLLVLRRIADGRESPAAWDAALRELAELP